MNRKSVVCVAVLAAVALLAVFASSSPWQSSMLVPGPEGVRAVNYGVQFGCNSSVYAAASLDALPAGFEWGSTQPSVLTLRHLKDPDEPAGGYQLNGPNWWYMHDNSVLRSEVQHPTLQSDPIGVSAQTVTYWRYERQSDGSLQVKRVVVRIVPADFIVQLSIVAGSGVYTWRDTRLWLALDTVTWLNSYAAPPDPDPPATNDTFKLVSTNYRGAFPIVAWIGAYQDWVFVDDGGKTVSQPPDANAVSYVQLDPSLAGRYVDLYTAPGSKYDLMLSSSVVQDQQLLEQALAPNNLPDPRFASTVYFQLDLTQFGAYVQPTGGLGTYLSYTRWFPSVYYRIRVVYAVYGEYVYLWTAQNAASVGYNDTTWNMRASTKDVTVDPLTGLLNAAGKWLSNPWNQLLLWIIGGVVLLVLLAVFAPAALMLLFRGGAKAASGAGGAVKKAVKTVRGRRKRGRRVK